MCSNFQPIKNHHVDWVKKHFDCKLPSYDWRTETYPTYPAPFIYLQDGKPKCELAQFGLVPAWAQDKKKYGLRTYNARSETVHEKPSYRTAWRERRFGIVPVEQFMSQTGKRERLNDGGSAEQMASQQVLRRFGSVLLIRRQVRLSFRFQCSRSTQTAIR